jgi:hypothetical protein
VGQAKRAHQNISTALLVAGGPGAKGALAHPSVLIINRPATLSALQYSMLLCENAN